VADVLQKVEIASRGRPRAFALATLGLTVLMLAGVLTTNVAVDPRAEFGGPLGLRALAPDAGADKLALYEELDRPPSAVVLGSSRAAALPPEVLGEGGFNFAVNGGGMADEVLVYRFLVQDDPVLRRVVVNIDVFGITEGKQVRLTESGAYEPLTGQSRPGPGLASFASTLSVGYTKDSARSLLYNWVTGFPEPRTTLEADGLERRPAEDAARAAGTLDLTGVVERQYADEELPALAGERGPPDPEVLAGLRWMIQDALDRGLRIDVFLPPYHALALERLQSRPIFHERVQAVHDLATPLCAPGLHFFDYTDGSSIGLDPEGYYDGHHVTPENGRRVLEAMDALHGDLCADQA
jgi:hypothetical protein